jgi:hypothetical protein
MINAMNNLPDTSGKSTNPPASSATIGIGKESEGISISDGETGLQSAGLEMELPKEVSAVGVTQQPTVVPIPPHISQLGVKPTGLNIPVQTSPSVVIPLSDSELAQGLHISVINSFRWLAEWCQKQLKMIKVIK